MTSFWIAVALMTLAIVLALLLFLRRQASASADLQASSSAGLERDANNLALYQQQLSELDSLRDSQAIDADTHAELVAEANTQLATELEPASGPTAQPVVGQVVSQRETLAVIVSLLLIPVLALALYLPAGLSLGGSLDWRIAGQLAELRQLNDQGQRQTAMLGIAQVLEKSVANSSSRLDLLRLKAEIYSATGQYDKAVDVFRGLQQRNPEDATTLALLAQAIYVADNASAPNAAGAQVQPPGFSTRVRQLLASALEFEPQQHLALSLSGMMAFTDQNFAQAISHWESALAVYGESSAQAGTLKSGIAAARQRLQTVGTESAGINEAASATATTTANIRLTVTIDPAQLGPDDSPNTPVFVFARPDDGSRMPLAARRLTLADLPADIVITERDRMAAQSIAGHQQVIVGARLARSGQPIAAAGDSESAELTVPVAASLDQAEVKLLTINKRR